MSANTLSLNEVIRTEFYVYEWYDTDTLEVFYVGKGSGLRYKRNKPRNTAFVEYVNSHNCDVRIVCDNMDECDAFNLENSLIEKYKDCGQGQTNVSLGGHGVQYMTGTKNPMYGRPWFDENTPPEKIDEWKRKVACPGERNAMYGVSPSERMDEKTYLQWRENHKKIVGGKNPNRKGVVIEDCESGVVKRFDTIGLCVDYLISCVEIKLCREYLRKIVAETAKCNSSKFGYRFTLADR